MRKFLLLMLNVVSASTFRCFDYNVWTFRTSFLLTRSRKLKKVRHHLKIKVREVVLQKSKLKTKSPEVVPVLRKGLLLRNRLPSWEKKWSAKQRSRKRREWKCSEYSTICTNNYSWLRLEKWKYIVNVFPAGILCHYVQGVNLTLNCFPVAICFDFWST